MQIISGILTVIMIDYIKKRGNVLATGSRISKVNRRHQIICIPQSMKLSHIV